MHDRPSGNLFEQSDVVIRRARPEDADGLFAIERQMFDLEQLPLSAFRRYLRSAAADVCVADHLGAGVGYAIATYRQGGQIGRLISLAVSDQASGRGIGRALVEAIIAAARTREIAALRLEVRADNIAAQRLYERTGFRRTGLKRGYYADLCDAVSYERVIRTD